MYDPQNDWSEDGTCIKCGGYALVGGTGTVKANGATIHCEGDCGSYGVVLDADGDLVAPTPGKIGSYDFTPGDPF